MPKKPDNRTEEEKRRNIMRHIHSKDTKPEVILRKALWHEGIRYRKNYKALPGKPDIAITKYKIAIFCDGEFWHGKNFAGIEARLRKNRDFWIEKIKRNISRDNETDKTLNGLGWHVLRFWSEDVHKDVSSCIAEVKEAIFQIQIDVYSDLYSNEYQDNKE